MTAGNEYVKQATDFLNKYGIKFSAKFLAHDFHFPEDKETRDIWKLTLRRGKQAISFRFGQSIAEQGDEPTEYDLLACITKNDPGSYEDFCSDFGYEAFNDNYTGRNKNTSRTYNAVVREWNKVNGFFSSEELEELQEIA
jgi:hypothetical protein